MLKSGGASTLDIVEARARDPAAACSRRCRPSCKIDAAVRSVAVRARGRSTAWSGRPPIAAGLTGADDPAVPGQLAQHADRRHLDPAVDPVLAHRPAALGETHQHHDAGRPGARGRHPGRRRHGRDREHPSQPGDAEAARDGPSWTARSRSPCRRSSRRCASASCSCRVLPHRRGAVPVHAAGDGGGVRDAGVLPPVAHAGADDGAATCSAPRSHLYAQRPARHAAASAHLARFTQRFNRGFERLRRAYGGSSTGRSSTARAVVARLPGSSSLASLGALPVARAATSSPRSMPARSACTCARPPARASRRPSDALRRRSRTRSAQSSRRRARDDHRQHRPARTAASTCRSATPSMIGSADGEMLDLSSREEPPSDAPTTCASCARELPRSTSRHRRSSSSRADIVDADSELRPAGAHRRAGGRAEQRRRRTTTLARQLARPDRAHARRGRRAPAQVVDAARACASTSTAPRPARAA